MRISDWSSDVCSSDLPRRWAGARSRGGGGHHRQPGDAVGEEAGGDRRFAAAVRLCRGMGGVADRRPGRVRLFVGRVRTGHLSDRFGKLGQTLAARAYRSEEHTSELQSLMRNSYAVFCLKQKKSYTNNIQEAQ